MTARGPAADEHRAQGDRSRPCPLVGDLSQPRRARRGRGLGQRDTYFNVSTGGLKLREQQPGRAHLIQFDRADEPQQRESRYRIVDIDDARTLLASLSAAIGVDVEVTKLRHLFLWQTVRIHLDTVERLGTFIELEAVAPPDSDLQHEHQLVRQLRSALAITDDRLIAIGYAKQLSKLFPRRSQHQAGATR